MLTKRVAEIAVAELLPRRILAEAGTVAEAQAAVEVETAAEEQAER